MAHQWFFHDLVSSDNTHLNIFSLQTNSSHGSAARLYQKTEISMENRKWATQRGRKVKVFGWSWGCTSIQRFVYLEAAGGWQGRVVKVPMQVWKIWRSGDWVSLSRCDKSYFTAPFLKVMYYYVLMTQNSYFMLFRELWLLKVKLEFDKHQKTIHTLLKAPENLNSNEVFLDRVKYSWINKQHFKLKVRCGAFDHLWHCGAMFL